MKKILSLALALVMVFALVTSSVAEAANPVAGKKVAYVMWLSSSTIFQMWKDSCTDLAAKLGVQFDFFFCDNDINKWQDTISS